MDSSRIFIKGLPLAFSETDIRSHFSQKGIVTDVRWMPKRRIAYIGYKSLEDARSAVKYFNKSYVGTSRITVEPARHVYNGESKNSPQDKLPGIATSPMLPTIGRKRKRDNVFDDDPESVPSGKTFQEFLHTITSTAKLNNWSNEVSVPVDDHVFPNQIVAADDVPQINDNRESMTRHTAEDSRRDDLKDPSILSDDEWLRARTTRLLGLTDNIDSRLNDDTASIPYFHSGHTTAQTKIISSRTEMGSQTELGESSCVEGENASPVAIVAQSGRLFVRNLSYETTVDDLKSLFSQYGLLKEVHLPIDAKSSSSKGFAYILYEDPSDAVRAFEDLDGSGFQGRLLHVLPAASRRDRNHETNEFSTAKLPLKKQMELKRKSSAASNQFNWNSMYMNADAVVSSVASRLGISKADFLDPTSSDAAVRQAHAETHTIQEVKDDLKRSGADLNAFEHKHKDDRILLLKNFPFGTSAEELRKLLTEYGELSRLVLPPAGTIAIAEYQAASCGRVAFKRLAYRKFKDSILFLEKGPKGLFPGIVPSVNDGFAKPELVPSLPNVIEAVSVDENQQEGTTIFIKNLNFSTTSALLEDALKPLDGFLWCKVKTKTDGKHANKNLSMGFGFAGFKTPVQARNAANSLNEFSLEGHRLSVTISQRGEDKKRNEKRSHVEGSKKIAIKNLPFEVTKKDVTLLLSRYGALRTIRLPKKLGNRTRGFAFAEFMTSKEAANAIEALKDTHLLGRRLVLEYALEDAKNPGNELERMTKKMSTQTATVELQQLKVTSKMQKIDVDEGGSDERMD